METPRIKFLGWVIILAIAALAGFTLPLLLYARGYETSDLASGAWISPTSPATRTSTQSPISTLPASCTHPVSYWASRQASWPAQVSIADFSYTKENAGASFQSASADLAVRLFIQFHTAYLNYPGAPDPEVEKLLLESAAWLKLHPAGSEIGPSEWESGQALGLKLADYNNGRLGPPLCAGQKPAGELFLAATSTPIAALSATPSAEATSTASATSTTTATVTRTALPRPTRTLPPPSFHPSETPPKTRTSSPVPSIAPSPVPTSTARPLPSATPENTPPGPPTPVPTSIPPPGAAAPLIKARKSA